MIKKIIIVLVIQTLLLMGMIGKKQYTLNTGTQILLETQPIDPRSLFRGDYVRLNYTISNLDLDQLAGDIEFKEHDTVYVVLQQQDKYWQAVSAHRDKPQINNDQVMIRGKMQHERTQNWNRETNESEPVNWINVRYGIENYFVPEGEGRYLERRNIGKVDIRVAVDKHGNVGIKAVLVNDEEQYVESLL